MPLPKFTIEQTTRFIQLYKEHACLWQSDTDAYRDKVLRKKAIDDIVAALNIPGFNCIDCQIKIKNVRSHYLQELKKIYNYNIRGARRIKGPYTPTLTWFNLIDSFLWNYIVHQSPILLSLKANRDKKDVDNGEMVLDTIENEIKKEHVDLEVDGLSVHSWTDLNSDETEDFSSACNQMIYEENDQVFDQSLSNNKKDTSHHQNDNDRITSESKIINDFESEFDIFGRGVAAQLKNLPLIEAVQLQLKIQQLITEHRLRIFIANNQDATRQDRNA